MMERHLSKPLLLTLMLAVFLDVANFFMPIPVFTPLLLHTPFLHGFSQSSKPLILGGLMACYGLAQLLGGPIFGELSDQHGRKKILIISLTMSIISCLLSGISLTLNSIVLVYISRFLLGFSSGTIAVVFALTADYSTHTDRAKNIGYMTAGTSMGAVLGPAIGGHLATSHFFSWFGYATPFYFMILPYIINLMLLIIFLSSEQPKRSPKKIHLFAGLLNIYKTIKHSTTLAALVFLVLLFQLGVESFYLSAPIIGLNKFKLLPAAIGNQFLIQGIVGIITSLFINKYLSQYISSIKLFLINIFFLVISFVFLLTSNSLFMFYFPFIGVGIFGTLCWIHSNNLFSQSVKETDQGLIFGVSQALWAVASFVGPLLVGFITTIYYLLSAILPVFFGMISFVTAIILMILMHRQKNSIQQSNL